MVKNRNGGNKSPLAVDNWSWLRNQHQSRRCILSRFCKKVNCRVICAFALRLFQHRCILHLSAVSLPKVILHPGVSWGVLSWQLLFGVRIKLVRLWKLEHLGTLFAWWPTTTQLVELQPLNFLSLKKLLDLDLSGFRTISVSRGLLSQPAFSTIFSVILNFHWSILHA